MKNFALAFILPISGCATGDLKERVVEVSAVQTEGETPGNAGLPLALATSLFHDVLSRLGPAGYVASVHELRDPNNPMRIQYNSQFTQGNASSVDLTLEMDGKHIVFHGDTDLDPESIAVLQRAAKLYQASLDERQIKYKVRTYTTRVTMEKS